MPDALTLAELSNLQLELLPARTVLSMLTLGTEGANGANGQDSVGTPAVNILDIPLTVPHVGKYPLRWLELQPSSRRAAVWAGVV